MQETNQKTDTQDRSSMRDTIRAAIDEQKEKMASSEEKKDIPLQDKESIEQKTEQKLEVKEVEEEKAPAEEKKEEKALVEEKIVEAKEGIDKKETKEEKGVTEKETKEKKVPFGIPKEIRANWQNFDENTQKYLAKVTKENLDLKSSEGRKYSHLRDIDAVLTPYTPEMQRIGVTPAQVVKRLLEYSDALASKQYKYAAVAKLAKDFDIDLTVFGNQRKDNQQQQQYEQQDDQQQLDQNYIPPELDNKLNMILDKFAQAETSQRSTNDKAASDYVNTWAGFNSATSEFEKKPYFPYVRQQMYQLIASGSVPFINGQIDLDGAYEAACHVNPEIREFILEDHTQSIAKNMENKKQQQTQAIQKAKAAGASIRPGAPAPIQKQISNSRSNNSGQQTSVRDSLRQALSEVRGA